MSLTFCHAQNSPDIWTYVCIIYPCERFLGILRNKDNLFCIRMNRILRRQIEMCKDASTVDGFIAT